jgi:hypothetical protein
MRVDPGGKACDDSDNDHADYAQRHVSTTQQDNSFSHHAHDDAANGGALPDRPVDSPLFPSDYQTLVHLYQPLDAG